jgi:hypothetical protein
MRLVRKVPKSMNRLLTSLLSGAIAFVLSFALVLIGTYIKCFFNDVEFMSSIAMVGALRGAAFAGCSICFLQFMAGGRAK